MSRKTIIRPVGEHRTRLLEKIGRDSWVYHGTPDKSRVERNPGDVIEVYLFRWNGIPRDVQEEMVKSRALVYGVSKNFARAFLMTHLYAIPCSHIQIGDVANGTNGVTGPAGDEGEETINVFRVQIDDNPDDCMFVESLSGFADVQGTLGYFFGLDEHKDWLEPGMMVSITVVRMSRDEFEALENWEE